MLFYLHRLIKCLLTWLQTSRDTFNHLIEKAFIEKGYTVAILVAHGGYDPVEGRGVCVVCPSFWTC
jgi:hypothetical protein